MKVSFEDARSGRNTIAVLKLYDRRFSPSLRRTYNPSYDTDAESAWHEYVRDGKAPALFAFLDEKRRLEEDEGQLIDTDSETDPSSSEDDWDRDSAAKPGGRKRKQRKFQTPAEMREKKGKRERIVQWKALDLFNCETRAYAELAHLQERYIPNLLAQVHLTIATPPPSPSSSPSPDQPTTSPPHNPPEDPYFQIPGILLSFIPGFNLTSLPSTPLPHSSYLPIIQSAVTAARHINDAGVINTDCQPRNIIVHKKTLQPFHIDFAQCLFARDMGWQEFGETKRRLDNQGAIGAVMVAKVRRAGVRVGEVRYDRRDWGLLGRWAGRVEMRMGGGSWLGAIGVGVGVGVVAWAVARGGVGLKGWV